MNKIYHLSTCDTCKRILSELEPPSNFQLQDIKSNPISEDDLEQLKTMTGNYEDLLNRRARLYQDRDLKNKELSEDDYRALLLEHYTFLKRPVIVIGDELYAGNGKKTVEAAKKAMEKLG